MSAAVAWLEDRIDDRQQSEKWLLAVTNISTGPMLYYAGMRSNSVILTTDKDAAIKFKSKGMAINIAGEALDRTRGEKIVPLKAIPH